MIVRSSEARKLVVFDVDGTLVDSQVDILAAMRQAFETAGASAPTGPDILSIVGLSLDVAMLKLAPDLPMETRTKMVGWYKDAYMTLRAQTGAAHSSPLYPGAMDALEALRSNTDYVLGVATGKSRRGLDKLLDAHGLQGFFETEQVSDDHPSKPHPSMLLECMQETMTDPVDAVMIGDTSYDIDMAKAAGCRAIGVGWGYHSRQALTAADRLVDRFSQLPDALTDVFGDAA